MKPQSTREESTAHDEETIRKDRTQHRRPDDVEFSFDESEDRDDQLDSISERCVEETSECVPYSEGEFFGCETEECGEGNDREEGTDENDGRGLSRKVHRPCDLKE